MGVRWIGISLLLASLAVDHPQTAATPIPPLHGTVLSGEKVDLPEAFQGKVGLLIVGFSQASRDQVTAWGRAVAEEYGGSAGVAYYQLAVLESVPRLVRGYVLRKIGDSVPPPVKPRFLPVLDHEAQWKAAAGYVKADDAYVLVVDHTGAVRFKSAGAFTDAAYAELKRQILAAQAH